MANINGAIILCDNVYRDVSGKFVIAGTYTTWRTHMIPAQVPYLAAYFSFVPHRLGRMTIRITITAGELMAAPLFKRDIPIDINPDNMHGWQGSIIMPGLNIQPNEPAGGAPPGCGLEVAYVVGLEVDSEFVATAQLKFLFLPPFIRHYGGYADDGTPDDRGAR